MISRNPKHAIGHAKGLMGRFGWIAVALSMLLVAAVPAAGTEGSAGASTAATDLNVTTLAAANETATVVETRDLAVDEEQSVFNTASGGTFTLEFDGQTTGDLHYSLAKDGTAAQGTLTMDTMPTDGDTLTIDAKTYTFQTVLTDVDGNIAIGGSLAQAQTNLVAAVNLTGTAGVDYAASMTLHPTVAMAAFASNNAVLTAKAVGVEGNSIATTETFTAGTNVFDAATLGATTVGTDSMETALEKLSNLTDVDVTGAGTSGNPWIVTFLDPRPKDVDLLVADDTNLVGGTSSIAEEVTGLMIIDPGGVTYLDPLSDELLIVDSEINEEALHFDGFNMWQVSRSVVVNSTGLSPEPGSLSKKEPTGVAYNPSNDHVFLTNDQFKSGTSEKYVYEIDPGVDGDYGTGDDTVTDTSLTVFGVNDPEDVAYDWAGTLGDMTDDSLFIAGGEEPRIFRIELGANGVLDSTDTVTVIELTGADIHDAEGIGYRAESDTILVIESGPNDDIHEMTKDGHLLRTIDVSGLKRPGINLKPADVTLAPASDGSGDTHMYVVDRGDDNNSTDPDGNSPPEDGVLYELSAPFNNLAPFVDAGPDLVVGVADTPVVAATVYDDGQPNPVAPAVTWSKVSGPGTVTFGSPNATTTTMSFSQDGVYVVKLLADDGDLTGEDQIQVTVIPLPPTNNPPSVLAGLDQTITLPAAAVLTGLATDDGLPNPPGALTTTWSKVSGPGTVTFGDASALTTTASFSAAGTYVLRLTADDSDLTSSDDLTVTVTPANVAPSVSAGSDRIVTLPDAAALAGTASDDGLPNPPGALTTTWSKVSGPGTVTFGDASALTTTASFSAAGTYVLRLTADDSALTATDDMTVTVNAPTTVAFTDIDGSIFEADIIWLAQAGITLGCNPEGTLFCPNDSVTRAQMASFLVRAYDLPAVAGNRFTDVSGTHLANINALAEAGITLGCNAEGTLFCPDDPVTRSQMASFLARAGSLDPIPGDVFLDVSGVHEPNINAIADAGITLGCNAEGTLFCPNDFVTRGQMAAFLHRALG